MRGILLMIDQMASLVLDVIAGLVAGTCLLRLAMQAQRIPFNQPLGRFVFAVTDWIVMPLRKLLPTRWQRSRWDWASLVAAGLLAFTQALLLWVLGAGVVGWMGVDAWLPLWVAVRLLVGTALQGLFVLLLLYAVLSWVQPHSPVYAWLSRLVAPLLAPIRRHVPLVGGVDLSPLVLVLAVQVALMLVG